MGWKKKVFPRQPENCKMVQKEDIETQNIDFVNFHN